jgi:hypothetical protein
MKEKKNRVRMDIFINNYFFTGCRIKIIYTKNDHDDNLPEMFDAKKTLPEKEALLIGYVLVKRIFIFYSKAQKHKLKSRGS